MTRFVIETTTHVPIVYQGVFEADTLEDTCRLAVKDDGWEKGGVADVHEETVVTGIWENADRAFEGTARTIPDDFRGTIQRKADLFDRLVVLLREPAQPMGIRQTQFERWLAKVQAALAEAEAISAAALQGG